MAGGAGTFRDDSANLVLLNNEVVDHLAERMAQRFHEIAHKQQGGAGQAGALNQPNPATANQWGGKGIIKFNPTTAEINLGIRQQQSLFVWSSPDGLPHYVTVDVGRLAAGYGGPGADGYPGGLAIIDPSNLVGQGSIGGGTWPAASDGAGNPYYYRAVAQVVVGTPGTMQDVFFVDINRGQRFTALASYVAVTAQMLGPPIDEFTGNVGLVNLPGFPIAPFVSGSLAVYATLGAAVAPSLAPVLYTQYIDNFTGNTGTPFYTRVIPPRANFLLPVLTGSTNNDTFQIAFYSNTGGITASTGEDGVVTTTSATPYATPGIPLTTPIAIPADCYALELDSQVGYFSYRLIYQLSV